MCVPDAGYLGIDRVPALIQSVQFCQIPWAFVSRNSSASVELDCLG